MGGYRGSRKHILDWVSSSRFRVEFTQLLAQTGVRIGPTDTWRPRGYASPAESRLDTFGPQNLSLPGVWEALRAWWLARPEGANTPNWDLVSTGDFEGRPGLVLVEAKAHASELSPLGKGAPVPDSEASSENHTRIAAAIEEARRSLAALEPTISISRDSHYQLSNRMAFAWKLASLGVPTALYYLGFTGDTGIADVGRPFVDADDWEAEFYGHACTVVPVSFMRRRVTCGDRFFRLEVVSRPVLEVSPPPESYAA